MPDYDRRHCRKEYGRHHHSGGGGGKHKKKKEKEVVDDVIDVLPLPPQPAVQQPDPTAWSAVTKDPTADVLYQTRLRPDGSYEYNIMGKDAQTSLPVQPAPKPVPQITYTPEPVAVDENPYADARSVVTSSSMGEQERIVLYLPKGTWVETVRSHSSHASHSSAHRRGGSDRDKSQLKKVYEWLGHDHDHGHGHGHHSHGHGHGHGHGHSRH